MTHLNAGLVIPRGPQGSAGQLQAVRLASSRGVRQVWSTAGGLAPDPLTTFAVAAATTDRIRLGTSILPIYPIHPVALAAQVLSVEGLAPGRFRLGVGTSHRPMMEGTFGLRMERPLSYLREYLTVLRGLLWEGAVGHAGPFLTGNGTLPKGIAPPRTPILMSALRHNAFTLAGEMSDGAISWVTPVRYLIETAIPAMERGAETAGRDERPPLVAHVSVAMSSDREAARNAFRAQFPIYSKLPFYAAMFADAGYPVTASQEMSDGLVDVLCISGTEAEVRERLLGMREAGLDELIVSHVVVEDESEELEQLSTILADRG
jgi:alkanesulfonate monooxygenase SsuD/methylene tetrahydromethanopterin reductase-like flavin-dependent oxidoreductase (luciferase family)